MPIAVAVVAYAWNRIAIVEEIVRNVVPRKRLAELLRRPRGRGMSGDPDVYDPTTFVGEDHQHEQPPTCCRRHDEEVRSRDLLAPSARPSTESDPNCSQLFTNRKPCVS
jgi:hypothetical protein